MKKLSLLLILLALTIVVLATIVAYDSFVKTPITAYTGIYKLEKDSPYLVVGKIKHLLLLAPPQAMDSLGIHLSEGDSLIVQAAQAKEALLVTSIQRGNKVFNVRSHDLKNNLYDETSTVAVIPSKCIACKLCITNCPVGAISLVNGKAFIDSAKCVSCGICIDGNGVFRGCPVKAISK